MICCFVLVITSTAIFANDLNNSNMNTSVNEGNVSENIDNETDPILKTRYEKEKAHRAFDNELLKLAASNESSDKELAKKIWNSMKKYQDHSLVLSSPSLAN